MQIYDVIMIVVLIGATLWGVYKGLAWQVASIASIFASYFVAFHFRGMVASQISAEPPWNSRIAMLILYLSSSLIIWLVFRLVKDILDRVRLKDFDQHVGGVLGAAKGVTLCVIITLFAMALGGDQQRQAIVQSRSGYYIAILLDKSHAVLPAEVHDRIHPLIHSLDASLPTGYQPHVHDHVPPTQPAGPFQPPQYPQQPGGIFTGFAQPSGQNPQPGQPQTAGQPPAGGLFNFR